MIDRDRGRAWADDNIPPSAGARTDVERQSVHYYDHSRYSPSAVYLLLVSL